MYKRLLCLLLGLMLCCLPALGEEELEMTNDEITRLLWEMYQTENGDIDYTVLPDDYQTPIEGKSGVYNLLLLGIDNPGSAITGRSDTMLLASLNARTGTLKLISFMRDTYVAIPHHGHNKLNAAYAYGGAELLLETLDKIQEDTVQPEKQKEEDSTYAKMLTRDMGELDFTKDALSLERTIRGLNSWPSAYTYYGGKMLKIWGAKVVEEEGNAVPGEVVKIQKDGFFIQTGKGLLKAEQVQLEGKKKMSAGDFLRGMQMQPGEKLGKEA